MVWHLQPPHVPLWPQPCRFPVQIMQECLSTGAIRNTKAFLGEMMPLAFQLTGDEASVVVTQDSHTLASTAVACMLACLLQSALLEPCWPAGPGRN